MTNFPLTEFLSISITILLMIYIVDLIYKSTSGK